MKKTRQSTAYPQTFWVILITLFAIVTISLLLSSFRVAPPTINQIDNDSGMVTLTLNPSTATLDLGTSTTIALEVDVADDQKLAAIQVDLELSSLCGNPEVTQGDFLPTVLSAAKLNGGQLKFAYGASLNSGGVEGTGTVATIKLTPTDVGSCQLTFKPSTKAAIVGSNDNSVKTASDSTITVAKPATASTNPSASPSQAPSQAASSNPSDNNNQLPSKTTTLRLDSSTCNSLKFSWDKIEGAKGYVLEIGTSVNFEDRKSSGTIGSDNSSYTFSNLPVGTNYYARITQTDIHDYPRYTTISNISTLATCPGEKLSPTNSPTPTPKPNTATVKPSPSTTPSSPSTQIVSPAPSGSVPSLKPVAYTDERFKNIDAEPDIVTDTPKGSWFSRFIAWLVSLFN